MRLDVRVAQQLLRDANYYQGPVDGDAGPMTREAVEVVGRNRGGWPAAWSPSRRLVAAAQAVLTAMGHAPGPVDGLVGHNTMEAVTSYLDARDGRTASVARPQDPRDDRTGDWPVDSPRALEARYGPPGGPLATAGRCELPFPFVIAWEPRQRVSRFSCHRDVAAPLTRLFREVAAHYGEQEFRRLRLDRFGGCFNDRPVRGGTRRSTHAWGVAVDLDPENNMLRWDHTRASFARPEYLPFWRVVEAVGATSLGRAHDFDWMHLQFARR